MIKLKVRKGDKVVVIAGKNKGKKGIVLRILPKKNKVIVSNVNIVCRHTKPSQTSEGGIIEKESFIHMSNIAHIDPKMGVPTRVGFKILEDGSKVRIAKKSGEIIDEEGK